MLGTLLLVGKCDQADHPLAQHGLVDQLDRLLLPDRQRVDFVDLGDVAELAAVANVPVETYVRATLRLDYREAALSVEVDGIPAPAGAVNVNGDSLEIVDVEINFESAEPLVVTAANPALLVLDFDLEASHEVNLGSTPATATAAPFVVATIEPLDAREFRASGPLVSVDETAGSYVLDLRPFHHRNARNGELAVENPLNADVTTAFPVDQAVGDLVPGVYVMTASPKGSVSDDDTFASQWFIVSDLGLAAYSGNDGIHVFVHSLATTTPLPLIEVRLMSRANEVLAAKRTDAQGRAAFEPGYARGEGALVEDVDGNVFLDCTAGIAVTSTGHSHPDVVQAGGGARGVSAARVAPRTAAHPRVLPGRRAGYPAREAHRVLEGGRAPLAHGAHRRIRSGPAFTTRAGLPNTVAPDGTSASTTAPMPTSAPGPISTPGPMMQPEPR